MSDIQTGSPAFPKINYIGDEQVYGSDGMTLRDYFAAKAMQSLVAGEKWLSCTDMPLAADLAYKMADAMLKERSK